MRVWFILSLIFQSATDLAARREVTTTGVTAEMWPWPEPRVPYGSLSGARRAPFKGSAA